jgi:hypothetical protein
VALVVPALTAVDVSPLHWRATPIRAYQIVSAGLLWLLFAHLRELRRLGALFWTLAGFTALVITSVTWSVHRPDTVTVAMGQSYLLVLAAMVALVVRLGIASRGELLTSLAVGATASSAACLVELVASYAGSNWQIFNVGGIPWHRPAGLMSEPDWAGLIAAVGLLVGVFDGSLPRLLRRVIVMLCAAAVFVTAVRAVWISVAVAGIVGVLLHGGVARRVGIRLAAVALVVLAGASVMSIVVPNSLSRFSPTAVVAGHGDQGAANGRLAVLRLIRDRAGERISYGHGAGTLGYVTQLPDVQIRYAGGGKLNAGHGSANLEATDYFDLGLPGLIITIGIIVLWIRGSLDRKLPGLAVAVTLLLVDFQFNNGIRFGFVWVLLALATGTASPKLGNRLSPLFRASAAWRSAASTQPPVMDR